MYDFSLITILTVLQDKNDKDVENLNSLLLWFYKVIGILVSSIELMASMPFVNTNSID